MNCPECNQIFSDDDYDFYHESMTWESIIHRYSCVCPKCNHKWIITVAYTLNDVKITDE